MDRDRTEGLDGMFDDKGGNGRAFAVMIVVLMTLLTIVPPALGSGSILERSQTRDVSRANGVLKGYVNDTSGAVVVGALVSATTGAVFFENTTNTSGYYELSMAPMTIGVDFSAKDHIPLSTEATMTDGNVTWLNVTLGIDTLAPEVRSIVVNPTGNVSLNRPILGTAIIAEANPVDFGIMAVSWIEGDGALQNFDVLWCNATDYPDTAAGCGALTTKNTGQPGEVAIENFWNTSFVGAKVMQNTISRLVAGHRNQFYNHSVLFDGLYRNGTMSASAPATARFNATSGVIEAITLNGGGTMDLDDENGRFGFLSNNFYQALNGDFTLGLGFVGMFSTKGFTIGIMERVPTGTYAMLAYGRDSAGHVGFNYTSFEVDNDLPVADPGSPPTGKQFELFQFNGSASRDNIGVVNYTWTIFDTCGCEPHALYGPTPVFRYLSMGTHDAVLEVRDAANNSAKVTFQVVVRDGTKPYARANENATVPQNTTLEFDGSDSFDNGEIANMTWRVSDVDGIHFLYEMYANYTFLHMGKVNVTLTVVDMEGNWDTYNFTIAVIDGLPPEAVIYYEPSSATTGEPIAFNGNASTDNIAIVTYKWTITGEGLEKPVSLLGVRVNYTFNMPGIYNITLRVEDARALWDEATVTITINNLGPEFTSTPVTIANYPGTIYEYVLDATDPEGDMLTYTLVSGPQGMTLDASWHKLVWDLNGDGLRSVILAAEGVFHVNVSVSDGISTAYQSYTLTVLIPPKVSFDSSFVVGNTKPLQGIVNVTGLVTIYGRFETKVQLFLTNTSIGNLTIPPGDEYKNDVPFKFVVNTADFADHHYTFRVVANNTAGASIDTDYKELDNVPEPNMFEKMNLPMPQLALFFGVGLAILLVVGYLAYRAINKREEEEEDEEEEEEEDEDEEEEEEEDEDEEEEEEEEEDDEEEEEEDEDEDGEGEDEEDDEEEQEAPKKLKRRNA